MHTTIASSNTTAQLTEGPGSTQAAASKKTKKGFSASSRWTMAKGRTPAMHWGILCAKGTWSDSMGQGLLRAIASLLYLPGIVPVFTLLGDRMFQSNRHPHQRTTTSYPPRTHMEERKYIYSLPFKHYDWKAGYRRLLRWWEQKCESINGWIAIPMVRCGILCCKHSEDLFLCMLNISDSGLLNEDLICWVGS